MFTFDVPLETLSKRLPTRIPIALKIAKVCIILRARREENQVKFTHVTTRLREGTCTQVGRSDTQKHMYTWWFRHSKVGDPAAH